MFTPSIVPSADDTVYIVEDDFGSKLGRVYRETDSAQCDRETTLKDSGNRPVQRPGARSRLQHARRLVARRVLRVCG